MDEGKKVRRNFSIEPKVDKHLDDYAEEWNVSRSEIVNRAVSEYVDEDKLTKLESMVGDLQDQVDSLSQEGVGVPSKIAEEKEKDSVDTTDTVDQDYAEVSYDPTESWNGYTDEYLATGPLAITGKRRQGKANRVYNLLMLEHTSGDIVSERDITASMESILGDLSTYLDDTYREMIHTRLKNRGWYYHSLKEAWYQDEAMITTNLEYKWKDEVAPAFLGTESPSDVFTDPVEEAKRIVSNADEFTDQLVENELATIEQAKATVANAKRYLSNHTQ